MLATIAAVSTMFNRIGYFSRQINLPYPSGSHASMSRRLDNSLTCRDWSIPILTCDSARKKSIGCRRCRTQAFNASLPRNDHGIFRIDQLRFDNSGYFVNHARNCLRIGLTLSYSLLDYSNLRPSKGRRLISLCVTGKDSREF